MLATPVRRFGASATRSLATPAAAPKHHRIVVVGAGAAGSSAAHQLLASKLVGSGEIAVVEPSQHHHYQPGWTLVGAGIRKKTDLRRPVADILDKRLTHYTSAVQTFEPERNVVNLGDRSLSYDQLIVCPGIEIKIDAVKGLRDALTDERTPVGTIYKYAFCDKTWDMADAFRGGKAIFTQPAGVVKCAGAPQKIMWLSWDLWRKRGLLDKTEITFATGLQAMFGVPRYNETLERLRKERNIPARYGHNLTAVEGSEAVFDAPNNEQVRLPFDMLHVTPPMGPYDFVKKSALANEAGFVDVDDATLQHKKFPNVWSLGDASSLPTSKTAAAVTAESQVLVTNVINAMQGKEPGAMYNGYTSCPIPTDHGHLLLAEFLYGGKPKETFGKFINQAEPKSYFLPMKTRFFPWVYFKSMVKGTWAGPQGWKARPAAATIADQAAATVSPAK
ncbi:FAD/NAD(P)-binding domain-containing protein [Jaminaea rosea]|uniref:Sulfide:quinone oxidoreductase, mitochondrial n=1 Tax=Jaminaea rosea TaxID=1569628 RepID=A0A316UIL9_9BASI|nr:FAD/NAD(P)-binding domain-containing protein [Jaminaea rosea]PWN25069.1 FAD/NAD(P)-binding domain-containing protein [Jaminaea rosea]